MVTTIVTGQQIGLLGGPLYTTYKVLGAIKLARDIGGKAVYWLETNDADFNEINHIEYLDASGDLRTLTWNIDSQGYSCGYIEIDADLVALLHQFFDSLRQTEFTPAIKEMVLRCYLPGRPLGEAARRLAQGLFGQFGLEPFDPAAPEFKAFMKPILLREAERTPPDEQCNLFCMIGQKRLAVFKAEDGGYCLRDGEQVNLAEHDLVPNVKTRNLCQDAYFQTHTYIAGPGEIKYIQELDPHYTFHGIRKAAVAPRMSATLLEPKARRLLSKHDLQVQDVLAMDKADFVKTVLRRQTGLDVPQLTQQAQAASKAYAAQLREIGLEPGKLEITLQQTVKELIGAKRAAEKAKTEGLLKAAETLSNLLHPFDKPQERVFNLFYYMNLYGGLKFVNWLYAQYDPARDVLDIAADF